MIIPWMLFISTSFDIALFDMCLFIRLGTMEGFFIVFPKKARLPILSLHHRVVFVKKLVYKYIRGHANIGTSQAVTSSFGPIRVQVVYHFSGLIMVQKIFVIGSIAMALEVVHANHVKNQWVCCP